MSEAATQDEVTVEIEEEDLVMTEKYLAGQLIAAANALWKSAPKTWMQMSERDQREMMLRQASLVGEAVRKAVHIIASCNRTMFVAAVDNVQFKEKREVRAVLSLFASNEAHDLAKQAGSTVLVVIENGGRYIDFGKALEGEAEQKPLDLGGDSAGGDSDGGDEG